MSWGTAISAGLNLAGGLLGSKGPSVGDLITGQKQADRRSFKTKMQLAKQYGIHPLTMLGVNTTAPTAHSVSSEPSLGQNLAMAGADIARSVGSSHSSNLEKLQERLLSAQIEGQEIDNVSRASQLARVSGAGNPPASSMQSAKDLISNMDTPFGRTQGANPLHKTAYDEEGNAIRMFNEEDLGDNDIAQLWHFLRYTAPDHFHNFGRRTGRNLRREFDRTWWNPRNWKK